jgi:predicted enzyme related to lactoylglutathione lyase
VPAFFTLDRNAVPPDAVASLPCLLHVRGPAWNPFPLTTLPMHGQFIWYELSTPDVDAAQEFYPRFTDWGTQPFDNDYTMWTSGGRPWAGIFRLNDEMRQQGVPPNWMPYIGSTEVDATARKVTALGGRVVAGPGEIPNVGRYAVVQDPDGATFGLYKPNDPVGKGWDGTPVIGRPSWHELMTVDYKRAFDFYRQVFGWEKTGEMDMGDGSMYLMFGKNGVPYGGMFNRTPDMADMDPFWLVYIHVNDVGEAVSIATEAGASVQRPQMDIPGGSIAILGDPQGAGFAVHHVNPPAAAAKPAAKPAATKGAARKAVKKAVKAVKKAAKAVKKAAKKAVNRATKRKAAKAPARSKTSAKTKPVTRASAKAGGAKSKKRAATRSKARPKTRAKKR